MKIGVSVLFLLACGCAWAQAPLVRPAAVAGGWYPGERAALDTYLEELLDRAPVAPVTSAASRVRAVISPHAGYRYSGAVAAAGARSVRGERFRRVIVLGPAHRGYFRGLSIAAVDAYATPLGSIELDAEAVAALRASPLVSADPNAHELEHSIELQLPLLQKALAPGWKLVPVLVGDVSGDDYAAAARLLRPWFDDDTLLVVSSDFTHYGPRFGYEPFPNDNAIAAKLERLDRGALDEILAKDANGFLAYQVRTGITVCGYRPIAVLLNLLPASLRGESLAYATSGAMAGDYTHSVSYFSVVFRAAATPPPVPAAAIYTERELQRLHALASRAVEAAVAPADDAALGRLRVLLDTMPAALRQPSGAFITLKKHGRLRGCIGYIRPIKPLHQAVAENGVNAAVRDRRFPPLQAEELGELEIEVSVLTPPEPIAKADEFRVGEQGIILEKDGRSAVFLPEVATEQGWNREQTLGQLSRKAGLAEDAWEQGAEFKVFRSEKYSAPYASEHKKIIKNN